MDENYKEVKFNEYCSQCKHENKKENEFPCDDCLDEPLNSNSEKPERFELKENVKYDKETEKWFKRHPGAVTTVARCKVCGLYYKPSLGHTCNKEKQ